MTEKRETEAILMLHLDKLEVDPERFQLRDFEADQHRAALERTRAAEQLEELTSLVERGVRLDPVLVVKRGGGRYCIVDGHHRLAAYRRAKREVTTVPAVVFHGTEEAALLEAQRENGKVRVASTKRQRIEAAWQLFGRVASIRELSVRRAAKGLYVSEGTISNFKRTYGQLRPEDLRQPGGVKMIPWRDVSWRLRKDDAEEEESTWNASEAVAAFVNGPHGRELARLHQRDPRAALTALCEMGLIGRRGTTVENGVVVRLTDVDFNEALGENYEDI